jgi:hypothetical protein
MTTIDFKRVTKKTVENIATKIRCNFCNKIIKGQLLPGNFYTYCGGEVKIDYGYGSKYDGCTFGKIHICDKCAMKLKLAPGDMNE